MLACLCREYMHVNFYLIENKEDGDFFEKGRIGNYLLL